MRVLHLHPGADTGGQSVGSKAALEAAGHEVRVYASSFQFFDYPAAKPWSVFDVSDEVRRSWEWADVVVLHNQPAMLHAAVGGSPKPLIVHQHGSHFRNNPGPVWAEGERLGALTVVSTVDLLLSAPGTAYWLPQVVDTELMAQIRADTFTPHALIRVAHAPTARRIKGTRDITKAARRLKAQIEFHLISRRPWADCLAIKAASDLFVDQLRLGYGANAVEAWAMGLPVVCGVENPAVLARMRQEWGDLPFYLSTAETLQADLRLLVGSAELRQEWAERGMAHVLAYHAWPAWVARFVALAERAMNVTEAAA